MISSASLCRTMAPQLLVASEIEKERARRAALALRLGSRAAKEAQRESERRLLRARHLEKLEERSRQALERAKRCKDRAPPPLHAHSSSDESSSAEETHLKQLESMRKLLMKQAAERVRETRKKVREKQAHHEEAKQQVWHKRDARLRKFLEQQRLRSLIAEFHAAAAAAAGEEYGEKSAVTQAAEAAAARACAGAGAAAELQVEGAAQASKAFAAGNALFQEMMRLQKVSVVCVCVCLCLCLCVCVGSAPWACTHARTHTHTHTHTNTHAHTHAHTCMKVCMYVCDAYAYQTAEFGEWAFEGATEGNEAMPCHWGEDDTDEEEEEGHGEGGKEREERSETQKVGKEMVEPGRARVSDQGLGRLGRLERTGGQTMLSSKLTETIEKQGLGGYLDTSHAQQTLNLNHKLKSKLGGYLDTSYAQRTPAHSPHVRFAREIAQERASEPDLDSADVSHDHLREAADEVRSLGGAALSRIQEIANTVQCGLSIDDDEATYLAEVLDLSYSEAFQADSSSSRAVAAGANEGGRNWSGQSELSRIKGRATSGHHGQHHLSREDALGRDAGGDGRDDQRSGREREREGERERKVERELNGPRASDGDGDGRHGGVIVQRLKRLGGGQGDLSDRDRGVLRTRVVAGQRESVCVDDEGWIRCGS